MKLLYPGSFNPFHEGHLDITRKACKLGEVTIASFGGKDMDSILYTNVCNTKEVIKFDGLLSDLVRKIKPDAIVRGLRNGYDLQYEMNMQYWNEDLGIKVPFIYFVCDRKLSHISSSAIREIKGIQSSKNN